ncbi:serine hydrolase domain-containing protein [Ferrimicrobium acidiphilum]|uniref:serine hydrolase domain-containing protein n=1 Tax=Ferrimicrobium acidiphilum TaxID=121039 RepID=UPI0023F37F23|nr:serine hydrolase domain-containing protein [Ferrimicrobium acidiphilum]MCL5053743.1 beta-lactamase family protein [Gammaproteobacteria bacterium]
MSEFQHPRPFDAAEDLAASHNGPILSTSFLSIDNLFMNFLEEHRVPGLVWGLVDGGGLIHHGAYGVSESASTHGLSKDSVFRIASMTKSFTALCVLLLRDQHKLSLDDPIGDWITELRFDPQLDQIETPITIRHLLSMSSGLVEDDPWADRQLALSPEVFQAMLSNGIGLDLRPSTAFEYSNLGYAMLGLIATRAAGVSLADMAAENIFSPLAMASTTWDLQTMDSDRLVAGHSLCDNQWVLEPSLADGAFGPMGGLGSTIEDLARWVTLHLNAWSEQTPRASLAIRPSTLREMADIHRVMAHPRMTDPDITAQGYGYGLMIAHHRRLGRIVGHSGGLPGFGSRMEWLPDYGVGLVALANRTYAPLSDVVRRGLEYLVEQGFVTTPTREPSQDLQRIYLAVNASYQDPENYQSIRDVALATYLLDRDDDRRPPNFTTLRDHYGRLLSVGPIIATGKLRGSWTLDCEHGSFTVHAMLGPTLPHKLQFLQIVKDSRSEVG